MTPSSDGGGGSGGGGGGDLAAEHPTAQPPRSRHRLHNFSFQAPRWGAQRILRCKSTVTASTSHHHQKPQPNHDDGPQPSAAVRSPWNLRIRRFRSSGNAPPAQHQAGDKSRNNDSTANKSPSPEEKSEEEEKGLGRAKFAVELTREEIEEDFLRMKGARPQRRPKKRARIVQKKLDKLFPGLWLDEITADSYKTND